jgi:sugar phosphate isomerase/epimerase
MGLGGTQWPVLTLDTHNSLNRGILQEKKHGATHHPVHWPMGGSPDLSRWRVRPRSSDTTASNSPAGVIISKSTRHSPTTATASKRRDLLDRHELQCHAISAHLVGQAVLDLVDERHKAILPPYVWGNGDPAGVNQRAAEELKNTARAAQKFGVGVVNGFTGSSIWHLLYSFPPVPPKMIDAGFELLAERFNPILDVFGECGVKFALEVHPTEIAFDIHTAQRALEVLDHREEFGFNFDPSHLHWQGCGPR